MKYAESTWKKEKENLKALSWTEFSECDQQILTKKRY